MAVHDPHGPEPVLRAVGLRTRQGIRIVADALLAPALEREAPGLPDGMADGLRQPQDA